MSDEHKETIKKLWSLQTPTATSIWPVRRGRGFNRAQSDVHRHHAKSA